MHINQKFITYNNCRCEIFIAFKQNDSDYSTVLQVLFIYLFLLNDKYK